MAKLDINFNGKKYLIDQSTIELFVNNLKHYLTTKMAGTGTFVQLDGQRYEISSTKYSSAVNNFVSYLDTIAGDGVKVTVNGVEYSVNSDKISGAVNNLENILNNLGTDVAVAILGQAILGDTILGKKESPDEEDDIMGLFSWDCNNSVEGLPAVIDTYDNSEIAYKISDWAGSYEELLGLGYSLTTDGQTNSWLFEEGSNLITDFGEKSYLVVIGDTHAALMICPVDDYDDQGFYFPEAGVYLTNILQTGVSKIDAQFTVGVPVNSPKVINDSWEEIGASVKNGTYSQKYSIGDYKEMVLTTGETVSMQIVAFDADTKNDGTTAAISWLSADTLNTGYVMRYMQLTNENGWVETELCEQLHNEILATIPNNIRSLIAPVQKTYYDYTTSSTLTCEESLWIPSAREVFCSASNEFYNDYTFEFEGPGLGYESYGPIYYYCYDYSVKQKKDSEQYPCYWWLRSADPADSDQFRQVSYDGNGWSTGGSNTTANIAIGFCM